jgi:hypothetical protein
MVELATLMGALFDGPDPVLDRADVPDSPALPERRYWLLHDLQGLLERAALETPLLICLDDLQWADGGTAAALRALPNRLATVPVAWILAFRPSPGSRQLQSALDGTVALGDPQCCLAELAWILQSDRQGELVEDLAEPVAGGDIGGDVVVPATQVLYEGVTGREDPR